MEAYIMANQSIKIDDRVYIKPDKNTKGTVKSVGLCAAPTAEVKFDNKSNITTCFVGQLTPVQNEPVNT